MQTNVTYLLLPENLTIDIIKTNNLNIRVSNPSSKIIYCPASQPYFNNKSCINCTIEFPLFNFTTKTCTKC